MALDFTPYSVAIDRQDVYLKFGLLANAVAFTPDHLVEGFPRWVAIRVRGCDVRLALLDLRRQLDQMFEELGVPLP